MCDPQVGEDIPWNLRDWCCALGCQNGLRLPDKQNVVQPLGLPLDEVTSFDRMGSEVLL